MPTLGTTLFSFTPSWRFGAELPTLLEQIAEAGCGPALEVVGHQAWRGFPAISAEDEKAFRSTVDRLGLLPVALGVYTDTYRRPGRPMSDDEALDDLRPQLEVAARLGFELVRGTLGMTPTLLRRAVDEAERLGIALTFELQGATAPDAGAVLDVLALQQELGTPYLGLTIDFSLTTPALPVAFGTLLRRHAVPDRAIAAIHGAWGTQRPIGARIGSALEALAGHPDEAELTTLVAGVMGRCGRWQPADWAEVLPLARHAHAKFWDPAVESVRASHGAWLAALEAAGYAGAVISEWGGHELLDRADADALTVTRAHLDLLAGLATGVTAGSA